MPSSYPDVSNSTYFFPHKKQIYDKNHLWFEKEQIILEPSILKFI